MSGFVTGIQMLCVFFWPRSQHSSRASALHCVILLSRDRRQAVLMPFYTDSFLLSSRTSAVHTMEYITATKAT